MFFFYHFYPLLIHLTSILCTLFARILPCFRFMDFFFCRFLWSSSNTDDCRSSLKTFCALFYLYPTKFQSDLVCLIHLRSTSSWFLLLFPLNRREASQFQRKTGCKQNFSTDVFSETQLLPSTSDIHNLTS